MTPLGPAVAQLLVEVSAFLPALIFGFIISGFSSSCAYWVQYF